MKKVLFVFPQWHFNLADTLEALTEHYEVHTLHFASADEVQQVGKIGAHGVTSHSVKLARKVWIGTSEAFMPSFADLWEKLSKEYDFVLFKNIYDPMSLLGFLICTLKGIPYGFSEQKTKESGAAWFMLVKAYAKIFTRHRKAVTPTKTAYSKLGAYTDRKSYIPFAIRTDDKPVKHFKQSKTVKVLNISKFQRRKDQSVLIAALEEVQRKHKELAIQLVLVGGVTKGNEYLEELRNQAKHSSIRVIFIDKIAREKLDNAYLEADAFVLASHDEPAAYSHLEAMARGLPVICSDENGTADYIQNGKNGFVFKARSKASLIEALEKMFFTISKLDWKKLARFGAASRKLAQTKHNPKLVAQQYAKVIG